MDQGDYLTVEELYAATRYVVDLPELTRRTGKPCRVVVRPIAMADYLNLLPLPPVELEEVPAAEATKRELAWLRGLPAEEAARHREDRSDVVYRTIALASLEPSLTVEQARHLGPDSMVVFTAILVESGILPRPPVPEAVSPPPPAADAP